MTDTKKHLTHLEAVGLIRLVKTHPELEFMFRHALIRDAAYKSLLREDRKKIHRQVAEAIEQTYPDQLDEHAASLAEHYTAAGLNERAITYWQRAGDYAKQRSANAEAIEHFSNGLELLKTLPATPEHIQQELALLIGLGNALILTKSHAAPEVEKTYSRAQELCRQVGETPQIFPVLYGMGTFYLVRGELQTARELGEQLLRLAQRQPDPVSLLTAHRVLASVLYFLGEFVLVQEHVEQALGLYDFQQHSPLAFRYGADHGVVCLHYVAMTLGWLGYPDQALERKKEAWILGQKVSHPFSLSFALHSAIWIHQLRREIQAAHEQAEALLTLSAEQGFPFWLGVANAQHGWSRTKLGQPEVGIEQIRQGLTMLKDRGVALLGPSLSALLAQAHYEAGQTEDGLNVLAEAFAAMDKSGMRWFEAELYRLKGELLLMQGIDESEIEQSFQKAIEVARAQQAKSLELRATVSLSRLWQSQGKQEEARQMLAEIYGWFTEGFDTLDLQEAKALLEELG